jgi:hypothetical protein
MGPDIDTNIGFFTFPATPGAVAQAAVMRRLQLGDFKLFGSLWSCAPWVKITSGNTISGQSGILPVNGTPWPFIWGGNFAGGKLDVSGTPLAAFDDSALGGSGPTSALTQFARATAAYVRGFQNTFHVQFYSLCIQNELNFEEFYNSCTYPLSSQYITALKVVRAEFDRYPDLAPIRLMGPEDLLGGDPYGMWQYGGGSAPIHKNLQYLQNIAADPAAASALSFFCIHGYANDGVTASGATPTQWNWWLHRREALLPVHPSKCGVRGRDRFQCAKPERERLPWRKQHHLDGRAREQRHQRHQRSASGASVTCGLGRLPVIHFGRQRPLGE